MRRIMSGICASALAVAMAVGSFVPAQAAPVVKPAVQVNNDVVKVDHRWRNGGYYRHGGYHHNRGWRRHRNRDVGIGVGAAIAGALITGAIINSQPRYVYRDYGPRPVYRDYAPRRVYRSGSAHVDWCYSRYRSYRAYDNSFQPYHGPRRACWSPYS